MDQTSIQTVLLLDNRVSLAIPTFQFSTSGFFGSSSNSNQVSASVSMNGQTQNVVIIGYDDGTNSFAGMAQGGFGYVKGNVLKITVRPRSTSS